MKPAPKLRPCHSIQDLHSSPHATASSAPHPLAAQPRSAEHAATLETGAPVGVRMLMHQLRPPPPFNQPRAQPAPILTRAVTQPSPLFPWFVEHSQTAFSIPARTNCGTPQLRSLRPQVEDPARTGRGPSFPTGQTWSASTEPSHSAQEVHSGLAGPASTNWILLNHLCGSSCISGPVRGFRGIAPCPVLQVHTRLFWHSSEHLDLLLVDLVRACENSRLEDRSSVRIAPRPMLKALSWLARIGQIEPLASLLSNPLAKAFASPQQPQERKEALPLPLAILASWERKVCAADCTHNLRITLGSFLLAAHTSMRFGDIQRIKIKEISLTQHALRGSCWATKTTKLGQPWACTLFGLTGRSAQSSWVIKWLKSLSEAVAQSISEPFSLPEPDFIMPVFACVSHPSSRARFHTRRPCRCCAGRYKSLENLALQHASTQMRRMHTRCTA